MGVLQNEIKRYRDEYKALKGKDDAAVLPVLFASYFYYRNDIQADELERGYTQGGHDGGISFLLADMSSEANDIILIHTEDCVSITPTEIAGAIRTMAITWRNLKNDQATAYSPRLIKSFRNVLGDAEGESLIFVFASSADIGKNVLTQVANILRDEPLLQNSLVNIRIYGEEEIVDYIGRIQDREPFVASGRVRIDEENNTVGYTNDKYEGIVCSVDSRSIRKLFEDHGRSGLFDMNLRDFIPNKKVDNGIKQTISTNREQFWFLNNGITIACHDYERDGNEIILTNFSIINGAQTTTLIATEDPYPEKAFMVPVKIVKCKDEPFLFRIAEASNSQKPIKPTDIKANDPVQHDMQKELLSRIKPAYMAIKRGIKAPPDMDKAFVRTNEQFGQLILAGLYQKPGTARSQKKKIFDDDDVYDSIFRVPHNRDLLVDLIVLENEYKDFIARDDMYPEDGLSAIVLNSKYFVIAACIALIQNRDEVLHPQLSNDYLRHLVPYSKPILRKCFPAQMKVSLQQLFRLINLSFLQTYNLMAAKQMVASESNLFKTDSNYKNYLLSSLFAAAKGPGSPDRVHYTDTLEVFDR